MSTVHQRPKTLEEATKPAATEPNAEVRKWQDEKVRQAVKEADAGDFATAEDIKATVRKFVPNG